MKKVLFIFVLSVLSSAVQAQNIRALFMSAPEEVLPLLPENSRADCLDYIDAGMEAVVSNRLDGTSRLVTLTDDCLLLQTTASSSMQIKLLPSSDGGTIVCVVKSVKAESENSHMAFYDACWNELPAERYFDSPEITDFFVSEESAGNYADKCDMYLVKYTMSVENATLVAEYTMPSYMDVDDRKLVSPFLKSVVYRWNGQRFVKE